MAGSLSSRMVPEVSPLRHVWDIAARGQAKDNTAYETFCALPSPAKPYTSYDYAVVAEIIRGAEAAVAKSYKKGEGSGIVTLQSVLQAYELVLPQHGIRPDEDTYFYRLLLKLSLDPEPDWWAKLRKESGTNVGPSALSTGSASAPSVPRTRDSRSSSPHRASPKRPARTSGTGTSRGSAVSTAQTARSSAPTIGGGKIPLLTAPSRSSASLAPSSEPDLHQDVQEALQALRRGTSSSRESWEGSSEAPSRGSLLAGSREPTAHAARIAAAQASRVAAIQTERAAAARDASWEAAREAALQGAAVHEALQAARQATMEAAHEAAEREAAVREAAQEAAVREAERQEAAQAAREAAREAVLRAAATREAVEAARQATLRADAARDAAILDAAEQAAIREVSREAAQEAAAREAALRDAAAHAAAAKADAARQEAERWAAAQRAGARRETAVAPLPRETASHTARDASRKAAVKSAAQAAKSVLAASAATDAARLATQGSLPVPSSQSDYSLPPRSTPSAPSLHSSFSAPTGPAATESIGTLSEVPYSVDGDADRVSMPAARHSARDATEYGPASSGYGPASTIGTTAPSSVSGYPDGSSTDGSLIPQSGARRLVAGAYVGGSARPENSAGPRTTASRASGSTVSLQREAKPEGGQAVRPGPMTYSVSRFIATAESGPPSTATGMDTASVYSASAATGVPPSASSDAGASRRSLGATSGRGRSVSHVGSDTSTVGDRSDSGYSRSTSFPEYRSHTGTLSVKSDFGTGTAGSGVNATASRGGSASGVSGAFGRGSSHRAAASDDGSLPHSIRPASTVSTGAGLGSGLSSSELAEAGYSAGATGNSRFSTSTHRSGASTVAASDIGPSASVSGRGYASDAAGFKGAGSVTDGAASSDPGFRSSMRSAGSDSDGASAYGFGSRAPSDMPGMSGGMGFAASVHGGGSSFGRGFTSQGGNSDGGADTASIHIGSAGGISAGMSGAYTATHRGGSEVSAAVTRAPSGGSHGGLRHEGSFSFSSGMGSTVPAGTASDASFAASAFQMGLQSSDMGTCSAPGSIYPGSIAGGSGFSGGKFATEASIGASARGSSVGNESAFSAGDGSAQVGPASDYGFRASAFTGSIISSQVSGYPSTGPSAAVRIGSVIDGVATGGGSALSYASSRPVASLSQAGSGSVAPSSGGGRPGFPGGSVAGSHGYSYSASTQPVSRSSVASYNDRIVSGPSVSHFSSVSGPSYSTSGGGSNMSFGGMSGGGRGGGEGGFGVAAGTPRIVGSPVANLQDDDGGAGSFRFAPGGYNEGGYGDTPYAGSVASGLGPTALGPAVNDQVMRVGTVSYSLVPGLPDHHGPSSGADAGYGALPYVPHSRFPPPFPESSGGFDNLPSPSVFFAGGLGPGVGPPAARTPTLPLPAVTSTSSSPDSDDSVLAEETQAYMDFSRMARAFRTWRTNTFDRQTSRSERNQALHNWAVATSFWAIQLLRRCFNRWRGLGPRKEDMAMAVYGDHSRAGYFRRWLVFTRYLRSRSSQCDRVWRTRLLQHCWRRWRQYTWSRQQKALAAGKARTAWRDRTLRSCLGLWREYSAAKRRKALAVQRAVGLWTDRTLRDCWREWQLFTATQGRMTLVMDRASAFWSSRWLRLCWVEWRAYTARKHHKTLMLRRAVELWRDRWLRACWREWRGFTQSKRRKVLLIALALEFWMGSSLRGCWRQWREFTVRRQNKALALSKAQEFRNTRTLRGCLSWWREYTAKQQRKAHGVHTAVHFRTGRTLRVCWVAWRQFTAKQQRKAEGAAKAAFFRTTRTVRGCLLEWRLQVEESHSNWVLSGHVHMRRVLLKWRAEAAVLGKLSRAYHTIAEADRHRLLLAGMQALTNAYSERNESSRLLRVALTHQRRKRLSRSLQRWRQAQQCAIVKRERQDLALRWSLSRCLAKSWRAWRAALAASHDAMDAARDHAQQALRPLLRDAFHIWLEWHEDKMLRRARDVEGRRIMESRRKRLTLRAWRDIVQEKRHLATSFQLIMRHEVHRLMGTALRQLRREHGGVHRGNEARRAVLRGTLLRCFLNWKALGKARLDREEWRLQQLALALQQRTRRLLAAWQLVACLHAEHGRLVQSCLAKQHRRLATAVIRGWRERVLKSVSKRMKMLAALLAWERGMKTRAWRSWRQLLAASHASASRFALAARHHRSRRLALCFGVLLSQWQKYRVSLGRAALYRSLHCALLQREVLAAWRDMVALLRWRNARMKRAIEHSRGRLLAGSMYAWFYITRHRLAVKQAVAVAVLHWVRRRVAAAFAWWRLWAVYRRDLNGRCAEFVRLRAARTMAGVLLALRANVVRNARIAGAVAHHRRYVARLALSGWLLRSLLAGEWINRLSQVGKQLLQQLLISALAGWLEYVAYRRHKAGMLRTALHYWRLGRQRSALDCLRWNATRRQLARAAVQRGRQGAAGRVLLAWRDEADSRRRLRDRYSLIVARNRRTVLQRGLEGWRTYLQHRTARRGQYARAAGHLLRGTATRAFRSWHAYHRHLASASEGARAIVRRWRSRDAAVVLAAFTQHVDYRRKKRAADAHSRRCLAALAMCAWREAMVVNRALDFWSRNRMTEILAAWSRWTRWNRGLHAIGDVVAARRRTRLLAGALAKWRVYAVEHARLMELGLQLANRTNRVALSAILDCWLAYAANNARLRHVSFEVAGRTCMRLLASALAAWHAVTLQRAFLRQTGAVLAARTQRSMLAAAFGHWCSHTANETRLRLASEQVSSVARRNTLGDVFGAWCSRTAWKARLRSAEEQVASQHRRGVLGGMLREWRAYAVTKAHCRALGEHAHRHMRLRTVHACITAWRSYAAYRQHLRLIEEHLSARVRLSTASFVLGSWRAYSIYKAHLAWAGQLVASRHHLSHLGRLFGSWKWYTGYKAGLWDKESLLSARLRQRLLSNTFGAWRARAAYKACLASALKTSVALQRRRTQSRVLGGWHVYAAYKAHLGRAEAAIAGRLRRDTLGAVFESWREHAAHMGALKDILERVLVRSTALAFFGWREVVAESKMWRGVQAEVQDRLAQKPELREMANYAVARLRLWPLSVAFYSWYDNAQEARYLRDKTTQAVFAYAGRLVQTAWATWLAYTLRHRHLRQKLQLCRAAARVKTQRAVLEQWREVAGYLRRLHATAKTLQDKVLGRALRATFEAWHDTTVKWIQLKGILARIMARQLSAAWEAWMEAVQEGRGRAQAAAALRTRCLLRDQATAFATWREVAACRAAARRLAARLRHQLLSCMWGAWQQVVFQAGMERGGTMHQTRTARRVLRSWRAVAVEARRGAELRVQLDQRLAREALWEWRRQRVARTAFRRLYSRRALLGWWERTQELRLARARLWHATRIILMGCLARCFIAWWQHTQAMAIKRAVFVRKQRALAEALRRGDELAARRNAELQEVAFRAWRLRAAILRQVHIRQTAARTRLLVAALAEWQQAARVRRVLAGKQRAVVHHRLLARPFYAWRTAAAQSASKAGTATAHRRATLLFSALTAWHLHHRTVEVRRQALRGALAAASAAAASSLKLLAWDAWCEALLRRVARLDLADQALRRRRLRTLGAAFDVWLQYTQAMRSGGIDPGSPYLSPRDVGTDRRLVTRMAAMAGNDQAMAGAGQPASASLLEGVYPSPAFQQAQERRHGLEAFLSAARVGAAPGGAYAASHAVQSRLTMSAVLERQRQRERRDSQGSAAGSSQGGGGGSVSTGVSSGAGGADLAEAAAAVVRATPGLVPAGKARPVGGSATPAPQAGYALAIPRPAAPLSPDLVSSPYDDRLDLRALYDAAERGQADAPHPGSFGGFAAARQRSGSPLPLPRAPTPMTASAPIAPRRIDFSASRGAAGPYETWGPMPHGGDPQLPYSAPPVPARQDHTHQALHMQAAHHTRGYPYPQPHPQAPSSVPLARLQPDYHQRQQYPHPYMQQRLPSGQGSGLGWGPGSGLVGGAVIGGQDDDSDAASTTSSDLLGPAAARARAAAAAAALADDGSVSWQSSVTLGAGAGRSSAAGTPHGLPGRGGGLVLAGGGGSGQRGGQEMGRAAGLFLGGGLARQAGGAAKETRPVGGGGGGILSRGSILDSRAGGGR